MTNIDEAALISLGMATDLARSCIQLTRFFDRDDMGISRTNEEVYCFDQELEVRVANHGSQRVKLVFMSNMLLNFPDEAMFVQGKVFERLKVSPNIALSS